MCLEVVYDYIGMEVRTGFDNPRAQLPVIQRGSDALLLPWGRRPRQTGALPVGGWARLESIHAGDWDGWFPKPVRLPVQRFCERDSLGETHWFDVTRGKWIQGLVAREGDERRVYVVTLMPTGTDIVFDRWPRILSG